MATKPPSENINELDFEKIRTNLLSFVKNNSEFKDYDFEASGLNFLVDLLAYNTQYSAYYLNQVANEMFLDTAQKRKNTVSIAKQMGYLTNSKKSSTVNIRIRLTGPEYENNIGTITIPKYSVFYGSNGSGTFPFLNWSAILLNETNKYSSNFDLVQGQFVSQKILVDNLLLEKRFKIESPDIDIDHLDVFVYENSRAIERTKYRRVHDITLLNDESEIYYLEQDYDGKYQVIFGDGVIGKDIQNNNIIEFEFIVTSGSNGNNCRSFDIADRSILPGTHTITTNDNINKFSSQGQEEETLDEIRNNARKMFFSQNRTVTEKDCEVQLQKYFPFIDSISVWGGEKHTPPQFGSVFCCVKPKERSLLTQDEKDFIISRLEQLNIITITPRIIDPDYTYITLEIQVVYNSIYLNIGHPKIREIVHSAIYEFAKENLLKFNRSFQSSSVQNIVKDLNQYFLGTSIKLGMYKKIDIKPGFGNYYKIDFNNEIEKDSLTSTRFDYADSNGDIKTGCYLKETDRLVSEVELIQPQFSEVKSEEEAEKLKQKKYNIDIHHSSLTNPIKKGIGIINYQAGTIELENFKPTSIENTGSTEMTFTVKTNKYRINPKREQILTISKENITVNPMSNDDEFNNATTLAKASVFET